MRKEKRVRGKFMSSITLMLMTFLSFHCAVKYTRKEARADTDVTTSYARMRATHSHFAFTLSLITNIYRIVMAHRVYRDTVKCIHLGSTIPTDLVSQLWSILISFLSKS